MHLEGSIGVKDFGAHLTLVLVPPEVGLSHMGGYSKQADSLETAWLHLFTALNVALVHRPIT